MYQLEDVKDAYTIEATLMLEEREFAQYLREDFVAVYDDELSFLGYERVIS